MLDPIRITQDLIRCPSVTPQDAGAITFLESELKKLGFTCQKKIFSEDGTEDIVNLYARFGNKSPNLCFAGHTDVVPAGDRAAWQVDPFAGKIIDDVLIGRGTVDMKGAIGCWLAAASQFISERKEFPGSLSLLITGDEESVAINGTKKMLKHIYEQGEKIDFCIVGEPSNPEKLGEMVKIGRRGSMNFSLKISGIQGHSAYPHLAENPVTHIVKILHMLVSTEFDKGTDFFQPTNLQVTSIDVDNPVANIIPASATARFNIRFNNLHKSEDIINFIRKICLSVTEKFTLEYQGCGEAFLTKPGELSNVVSSAVEEITGMKPELSTTGGTSDARFIKDYCQVVEFGLMNKTAHKVDEHVKVSDILKLTDIYKRIMEIFL